MIIDENTLTERIKKVLHTYINKPQRYAFVKGLISELDVKNPYTGNSLQNYSNKVTFQISFFNAFNKGRELKIKYNYQNQKKILFT